MNPIQTFALLAAIMAGVSVAFSGYGAAMSFRASNEKLVLVFLRTGVLALILFAFAITALVYS